MTTLPKLQQTPLHMSAKEPNFYRLKKFPHLPGSSERSSPPGTVTSNIKTSSTTSSIKTTAKTTTAAVAVAVKSSSTLATSSSPLDTE
jgi:hypothetical protein